MKLPHHNRITQTVPDCMHTFKDVEKVFHLLTGREDTVKVRKSEIKLNRFGLEPVPTSSGPRHSSELTPCYRLSKSDVKLADNRVNLVILPSQDFTPTGIFSRPFGLKPHNWKEVHSFCI